MQKHPRLERRCLGVATPVTTGRFGLVAPATCLACERPTQRHTLAQRQQNWHCAAAIDLERYPAAIRPEPIETLDVHLACRLSPENSDGVDLLIAASD